jgi:glycosyl transferase family 25
MNNITFRNCIEELTKTKNIEIYTIHLERATERLPLITNLESNLKTKINIFPAADGYKLIKDGHPTTCQQRGPPAYRGGGDIGCSVSHINICRDALLKGYDYIVIFEDDCEFVADVNTLHTNLKEFINLNLEWDLFLLGWDPQVSSNISNNFSKVSRFNCSHAVVLNKTFMQHLVRTYDKYYSNNTTLSIDTTYSNVIEENNLNAYGFKYYNKFFIQKQGMYSYIVEKVR